MDTTQIPQTLPPAITISRDTAIACMTDDLDDYGTTGPVALAWQWALTGHGPTPIALENWDQGPPSHTMLVVGLAWVVADLDPSAEDQTRAREALLGLFTSETESWLAASVADAIARLSPTVSDLRNAGTWPLPSTPALLAAARHNSGLPAWLAALPLLGLPAPQLSQAPHRNVQ
jgi:hypothetical protein